MLNRLRSLLTRHRLIEAQIQNEQQSPQPDSLRIFAMKRARLRLREEIARLEGRLSGKRPSGAGSPG